MGELYKMGAGFPSFSIGWSCPSRIRSNLLSPELISAYCPLQQSKTYQLNHNGQVPHFLLLHPRPCRCRCKFQLVSKPSSPLKHLQILSMLGLLGGAGIAAIGIINLRRNGTLGSVFLDAVSNKSLAGSRVANILQTVVYILLSLLSITGYVAAHAEIISSHELRHPVLLALLAANSSLSARSLR